MLATLNFEGRNLSVDIEDPDIDLLAAQVLSLLDGVAVELYSTTPPCKLLATTEDVAAACEAAGSTPLVLAALRLACPPAPVPGSEAPQPPAQAYASPARPDTLLCTGCAARCDVAAEGPVPVVGAGPFASVAGTRDLAFTCGCSCGCGVVGSAAAARAARLKALKDAVSAAEVRGVYVAPRYAEWSREIGPRGGSLDVAGTTTPVSRQDLRTVRQRIAGAVATMDRYADPALRARARATMPVGSFVAAASTAAAARVAAGEATNLHAAFTEALLRQLVTWFKGSFFSWCNAPACGSCSCRNTECVGVAAPNAAEAPGLPGAVEVYRCTVCGSATRFPRYNEPGKLLETRTGRCGEWANAFTLLALSLGLSVRYVVDFTDHVWTEVWLPQEDAATGRWVHVDACEAAVDAPLLYESGWGKKLTYVVAVGEAPRAEGGGVIVPSAATVLDVTPRYTRKRGEVDARRTLVPEPLFAALVDFADLSRRPLPAELLGAAAASLSAGDAAARAAAEAVELAEADRLGQGTLPAAAASEPQLPGRTTGSLEWRAARGELGAGGGGGDRSGEGAGAAAAPAPAPAPAPAVELPPGCPLAAASIAAVTSFGPVVLAVASDGRAAWVATRPAAADASLKGVWQALEVKAEVSSSGAVAAAPSAWVSGAAPDTVTAAAAVSGGLAVFVQTAGGAVWRVTAPPAGSAAPWTAALHAADGATVAALAAVEAAACA